MSTFAYHKAQSKAMSADQTSLLGTTRSSYGSQKRQQRRDLEDPMSSYSRTKSWHKHDSDLMTGGDHSPPSAFAPLIRTMSSGRAAVVAGNAAEPPDKKRRPVAAVSSAQDSKKGGQYIWFLLHSSLKHTALSLTSFTLFRSPVLHYLCHCQCHHQSARLVWLCRRYFQSSSLCRTHERLVQVRHLLVSHASVGISTL